MELIPTEKSVSRQRMRLVRRMKRAYQRIEFWEHKHKLAMDELRVFMLRFPRANKSEQQKV